MDENVAHKAHKALNYYSFELTVTQKCDMACTYCFEGEELQNKTKALEVTEVMPKLNELLDSAEFMSHYDGISIQLWGGEPSTAVNYIVTLFKEFHDKPVNFFMYTNGFNVGNLERIINNLTLAGLSMDRFSMQISYDGISHDKERIDHEGKGTATKILANIKKLMDTYPDLNLQLKATLPIDQMTNLVEHWHHWKEIVDTWPQFSWSPTLEYTNKYVITDEQMKLITQQFTIIAALELEYFKKYNRFVFSWFGTEDAAVCSAGAHIGNVDLEGNVSVCHGALYSPNKADFIVGNIKDDGLVNTIMKMKERHEKILEVPEHCKGCEATVCYQCPIVQYDNSDKETYEERYHDPKTDLCSIYKSFGKIDRTVQRHLNIRK